VVAYVVSAVALFVLNLRTNGRVVRRRALVRAGALLLFHDWVGTVWNFRRDVAGILAAFVSPPCRRPIALSKIATAATSRADPKSWTHAGLGYRVPAVQRVRAKSPVVDGLADSLLLPASTRRWLARRRESDRIDFRIGFLNVDQRRAAIAELSANGLEHKERRSWRWRSLKRTRPCSTRWRGRFFSHANDHVTSDRAVSLLLWCRAWSSRREIEGVGPCHRSARSCSSAFVPGPLLDDERESVSDSCRVRPIDPSDRIRLVTQLGIRVLRITRARYSVSQRARRTTTSSKPSSKRSPSVNGSQSRTRVWRRCDYGRGRGSCLIDSRCYRYPNSTSPRPLSPSVRTPSGNGALTSNW